MSHSAASQRAPEKASLHALSFDIEDWFHIVEIEAVENPARWDDLSRQGSIVERYTERLLRLCAEFDTRATFFVLGWIAEKHPALVRRIAEEGHELASHSFWHRKVYELSASEFHDDVARSLGAIRAAVSGQVQVDGFRAPSFSIVPGTEWAFDVLLDLGFMYDASLFPAARGHGGYPCVPGPQLVRTASARHMRELPMSIARVGVGPIRKRMCYSGGGYFRLLPLRLIEQGIAAESAVDRPTVVYLHPRDFASDAPRVPMPFHRRFKCYVGTSTAEAKLRKLLQRYRWDTCRNVLAARLPLEPVTSHAPGQP